MDTDPLMPPGAYRQIQPQTHIPHPQSINHQHGLSQNLTPLLDDGSYNINADLNIQDPNEHAFPSGLQFNRNHVQHSAHLQNDASPRPHPHTPQHVAQFGSMLPPSAQHSAIGRLQQEESHFTSSPQVPSPKSNGLIDNNEYLDPNPPNLEEWRNKLFVVDSTITLSEKEYKTYFPHVDNVYSHRSTQTYKKKPFVSHYWDCRLKGRPPGTKKSDDPNKKKRKRTARDRDQCDVKIKITEYFPNAMLSSDFAPEGSVAPVDPNQGNNFYGQGQQGTPQQFGQLMVNNSLGADHPGARGDRFYTIQRVNGNGGNGKMDGVPGPHRHDLAMSDKIKKNSVIREQLKKQKIEKKTQKTYHKKATGNALVTVRKHSKDHDLKLFASCFCPFAQRVWIAMEAKGLQYQYVEIDPYKKPQILMEANPRGLVPSIRHGNWACGESTVLMEYLEDMGVGTPLLPQGDPQTRATCRLWGDHVNRNIVPLFYTLLQAQDFGRQQEVTKKLQDEITKIVQAANEIGPFFLGPQLSYVDVQFAPWMIRFSRVLKPYRGWDDPAPNSRWLSWMNAVENNEHVKSTTSSEDLYRDSYERYADNRPGTSALADAINGGYGLP